MNVQRQLPALSALLPALVLASCSPDDGSLGPAGDPAPETGTVFQEEGSGISINAITEAPAGFDNVSNGFLTAAEFAEALAVFSEVEEIADGLGPLYNAQSCRECHQNPVTGGGSQIGEFRAGHFTGFSFVEHPGGSLLNDRAIDPRIQERIAAGQEVRTFRISLSLMGAGFVESIDSNTLAAIAASQPAAQRGVVIQVPVLEDDNSLRVGRFGHKNQHASLISFSADAYLNEMGITSPLAPNENTSNGASVAAFDTVADPEDDGEDIKTFASFMRALKVPPRDTALAATASAQRGATLFTQIGCAVCHTPSITTAPAGSQINGGQFTVPPPLGDKIIRPFGDYLLHDVGTGDGIVQNGGQGTRNLIRTAPLWGLRTRDRLMHDGATVSRGDAINRHGNQAAAARNNFNNLSTGSQNDLITFLNTL
jgi:CxxC motif-containing protein (DUF1111 family)